MISKTHIPYYILLLLVLVLISACNTIQAPPVTSTPEEIIASTHTPLPTATSTATSLPTPSQTPSATPSPSTTPTQTPSPTATPKPPEFSNLILALDYNQVSNEPLSPRDYFPLGVSYIAAVLDYNVQGWNKLDWVIYDVDEKKISSGITGLTTGEGKHAFIMRPEKGLDEGNYELILKLDDETVLSHSFDVFWTPTLWPISIGKGVYQTGEAGDIGESFPFGVEYLAASYPTINFQVGDELYAEWFVDGEKLGEHQYTWDNSEWSTGIHANAIENQTESGSPLPIGDYEIIVSVNGIPAQCKAFTIVDSDSAPNEAVTIEPSDLCQAINDQTNGLQSSNTWDRYQPRTFAELDTLTGEIIDTSTEGKAIYLEQSPDYQYPSRISVQFTGSYRDTPKDKLEWITAWMFNQAPQLSKAEVESLFGQEALFTESSTEYWLPVQNTLIPIMEEELTPGDEIELLVVWMGAVVESGEIDRIYLVNAFEE
jgi:hypothetical protein